MDKKKELAFNLNNFLLSISVALDLVEKDITHTSLNHSKRLTFLSLKLGERFDLTPQEMSDLCTFTLVHNISLKYEKENTKEYFTYAEECIKDLPFLCGYKNVLMYQSENYDGSGIFGLKGKAIPLLSQIISFSHLLEKEFDLSAKNIENKKGIIDFLEKNEGILFSEEIINHFLDVGSKVDFWLDIQNEKDILYYIFGTLPDFTIALSFEDILKITTVFSNLVDKNNTFIEKCSKMADFYKFNHKEKQTFLIAASLQNIGKLAIPNKIILKDSKLTDAEYKVMKTYPYYTKKILSNLIGFNDITTWASRVQERIDGEGYPYGLRGDALSLKDKLMATLNIYNSLLEIKPYREAYSHKKSIKIMNELASNNKLDKTIVENINIKFS